MAAAVENQEKDSVIKQARSNTPSDSKLKQVRFITSDKPTGSICASKNSKPAMAKQMREAKQSGSTNQKEEVYEVEAILSHRKRQRCKEMEFLLKWKGYSESENSWEPLTNLNCHDLLRRYMLKHKLPLSADLSKRKKSSSPSGKQAQIPEQISAAKRKKPRKAETAKETRIIKKQPVKIKLPRKRQPTTLLNTKGGTTTKKIKIINRKSKATHKISTPRCEDRSTALNGIQQAAVSSGNEHSVASGFSHIRTQAQATPASASTSSVRDQDQRCHIAAFDTRKPTTINCASDDEDGDSDVIITSVDPPHDHQPVTPPTFLSFNPNLNQTLSPTDLYFSFMSFPRRTPAIPTDVPPPPPITTIPTSPDCGLHMPVNQGLRYADSDGSTSLLATPSTPATLTGASPSSSPLISSPLSDNSFKLQLSPSGSSAGECESPCKSSLKGAPVSQSPLSSYVGLLTALSSGSGNLPITKLNRSHKNGTRSVLSSKGNKKRLNGNHHVIKSNQTCSKVDRRGRMGPVPRPCQPVHSQSTSLQTKAAKEVSGTSTESATVQSHPTKTSHFPSDEHMSVIFKFNGMCKQYVVRKRNLCAGSDDSDTDSSTKETSHLPAKKQVKMTHAGILSSTTNLLKSSSTETGKKAAPHRSSNGIVKNSLLSTLLHKSHNGIDKANENLSTNELNSPACDDPAASSSSSGSLTCIQSLQKPSSNKVRSGLIPSSLSSTESVNYKQILLDWQFQLNRQRGGTDDIIFVENEIDMAEPPKDFTYISSNIYGAGVPDPNLPQVRDSLCGCQCYHLGKRCGPKAPYCCSIMADVPFAYTLAGKVCVTPGTPIYECNWKCSCPMDCINRVVQHGRKIPLCIFRTNNRGWGVKTLQPIKANTFVTEYVGEVITSEEAEKRGRAYDEEGETYLFDLDFDDDQMFTIDAKKYGNISHFFNHSCDPNLVVYSVWIDTLDKRLPRIAFFTTKNVSAGEELTFDYQMNHDQARSIKNVSAGEETNLDQARSTSRKKIACRCGSKNCLQYIN